MFLRFAGGVVLALALLCVACLLAAAVLIVLGKFGAVAPWL
jgi:hypothetical protein